MLTIRRLAFQRLLELAADPESFGGLGTRLGTLAFNDR